MAKETLSHRERVELTLAHQEPDRVPIDLLGSATLIVDDTYFALLDHLGLSSTVEPWRKGFTANYYDERLLEVFDVDFRRIFMPLRPEGEMEYISEDTYVCPWGITWQHAGPYINPVNAPLENLTIDEIWAYDWPKPQKVWDAAGMREKAKHFFDSTSYALVARNPVTFGLLDRGSHLRGMAKFMKDLVARPDLARVIIEKVLEVHLEMYDIFLSEVGPFVQVVETADDLGGQDNLLISPDFYRKYFKPAQTKINDLIKSRAPRAKVVFHSDGAIRKIIPDLIETGVDILNPVQPSAAGMASETLKKDFGDRLVFHGGVDQKPQEGSEEDVRQEVRKRIDALAPGGGYILSTCNNILGAPPANIVAMMEEAKSYGRY